MSATLHRSAPVEAADVDPQLSANGDSNLRRNRPAEWMRTHSETLRALAPILVLATVVNVVNLANAPALSEAEGTVMANAFVVAHFAVTVLAARYVMVAATLLSAALVWFLSRRLGFGHAASAIATIVFALSPLAIQLHRTVSLDNVATPWLLAALLLATTRRRQLLGFAASAAAFGIATLSQEAFVVALPVVAFAQWRTALPQLRRYILSVAAAVVVLIWAGDVTFALINGDALSAEGFRIVSWVTLVLPFAALVLAGVVDRVLRAVRSRDIRPRFRIIGALAVLVVAVGALAPTWVPSYRELLGGGHARTPTSQAEEWVATNVPSHFRVIVDDSLWVDLVNAGFPPVDVVRFRALDNDPTVQAQSPQGWKDSDYVVSTEAMRMSRATPSATLAISNSVVVASFGTGDSRVQVRRIEPAGLAQAATELTSERAQRTTIGNEIVANPNLSASALVTSALRAGSVDPRIPLVVGQLASAGTVVLSRLPIVVGEAGLPVRQAVITSVGGHPLSVNGALTAEGRRVLSSLSGVFAPQFSKAVSDGLLIEFSVELPVGIIQ